jgi:hypothetical protein
MIINEDAIAQAGAEFIRELVRVWNLGANNEILKFRAMLESLGYLLCLTTASDDQPLLSRVKLIRQDDWNSRVEIQLPYSDKELALRGCRHIAELVIDFEKRQNRDICSLTNILDAHGYILEFSCTGKAYAEVLLFDAILKIEEPKKEKTSETGAKELALSLVESGKLPTLRQLESLLQKAS